MTKVNGAHDSIRMIAGLQGIIEHWLCYSHAIYSPKHGTESCIIDVYPRETEPVSEPLRENGLATRHIRRGHRYQEGLSANRSQMFGISWLSGGGRRCIKAVPLRMALRAGWFASRGQ
jgi:hypothetical protein